MREQRKQGQKRPLGNPALPANQTWKCAECGFLLAYLNKERDVARIKYKDLYVEVGRAQWIKTTCRRCALVNEVDSATTTR